MFLRPTKVVGVIVLAACVVAGLSASSGRVQIVDSVLSLFAKNGDLVDLLESIKNRQDFTIETGSSIESKLKIIGEKYGTGWKEVATLNRESIKQAWQEQIIPKLREKWKIGGEAPTRRQQRMLNDICERAKIRDMNAKQFAENLLTLGLEQAGLGFIQDIRYFAQFLDPEIARKGALCLVKTRLSDEAFAVAKAKWPKVLGAGECLELVRDYAQGEGSCGS